MSRRHRKGSAAGHRRWILILMASTAAGFLLAPGLAWACSGMGGDAKDDPQIIADAKLTERGIVATWNARKWDEFGSFFAQDAVFLPPNHEPVQGRDAITDYYKSLRDVAGAIDDGWEYVRVKGSGRFASLTGKVTSQSGHFRMSYTSLYERQPDGSVLVAVDELGFREQPVG